MGDSGDQRKQKSLKINFIMNTLLSISSVIFPLISFPYVSRVLLPDGMGKVSFATSIISYFTMIAMLGVPVYGVRACAMVRNNKEQLSRCVQEILLINIIMSTASYLLLTGAVFLVPRLYSDRELFLILSFSITLNVIGVEWFYKALEMYSYITIRSLIFKALSLILLFLFVKDESDYVVYGAITLFSNVGSYLLNFVNLRKYIILRPLGNYDLRKHVRMVAVFFAMTVATTIYTNLDTVMLGFLQGDTEVGYYNAAVKVKSVLLGVVTSLGAVLMPRASYYISRNMVREFNDAAKKSLKFAVLISTPLVVYFMIYAKSSINLLSGKAYEGAVVPMQIIMPTILFIGITNVLGMQILVPMKKENVVLISECAGAVTDFVLNLLWIPRFSAAGAAMGTLVAELVVLVVQYVALREMVLPMVKRLEIRKVVLSAIAAILAVSWLENGRYSSFYTILISSVIFFGTYFFLLLAQKEYLTIDVVRQILKKK